MACTCVHVYMCMRAHVYMCTCEHALHTCVHASANACVRACIRVRANACVRTCECMRANMHTCTCECMCTCVHAHARACIAYMRETTTDIHTETHRYTLIHTYTVLVFVNTPTHDAAQKLRRARRHGTAQGCLQGILAKITTLEKATARASRRLPECSQMISALSPGPGRQVASDLGESWESQESREPWSLRILGSLGVSGATCLYEAVRHLWP